MSPKTDIDGYPTLCIVCSKPIQKTKHSATRNFDHETGVATSWHNECAKSVHVFYCKGTLAKLELVLGSWFCSVCGGKVDWIVT